MLKAIWLLAEQMCSKRLKAALPIWLPFYKKTHGRIAPETREKLLQISPAAMDRLLKKVRARYPRKGLSGTRCGAREEGNRVTCTLKSAQANLSAQWFFIPGL